MSNSINLRVFYGNGQIRNGPSGVDLSNFPFTTIEHPNPEGTRMPAMKIWFTQFFQLDPDIYSVTVHCMWTRTFAPVVWELKQVNRTEKWVQWLQWCRRRGAEFNILVQACPKEANDGSSSATPTEEDDRHGHGVSQAEVEQQHMPEAGVEQRHMPEADVVVHRQVADVEGQADAGEENEEIVGELQNVDRNAVHEEETLLQSANVEGEDDDDDDDDDDDGASSEAVIPDQWKLHERAKMVATRKP